MGDDLEGLVKLIRPDGKSFSLDSDKLMKRAREVDLPIGLSGHTITCPQTYIETGTDCDTCKYNLMPGCEHGISQTDNGNCSTMYNNTDMFCSRYETYSNICTCGMDKD